VQLVIYFLYLQLLLGTLGQHVIGLNSFDPHQLLLKEKVLLIQLEAIRVVQHYPLLQVLYDALNSLLLLQRERLHLD